MEEIKKDLKTKNKHMKNKIIIIVILLISVLIAGIFGSLSAIKSHATILQSQTTNEGLTVFKTSQNDIIKKRGFSGSLMMNGAVDGKNNKTNTKLTFSKKADSGKLSDNAGEYYTYKSNGNGFYNSNFICFFYNPNENNNVYNFIILEFKESPQKALETETYLVFDNASNINISFYKFF